MAKIREYPKASLRAALQLADAVDGFAGSCSAELAAEKLGRKISGAFSTLVASTAKYGLIENKSGKLSICPLYRSYKLAYTPDEAMKYLREAVLSPPLFHAIFERFHGQRLPIEHFEKMLIREFEVPEDFSSRVASYFLEGVKQAGLLSGENYLTALSLAPDVGSGETSIEEDDVVRASNQPEVASTAVAEARPRAAAGGAVIGVSPDDFWINIRGPGMNFSIEIQDVDDLELVRSTLRKIERAIKIVENEA